MASTILVRDLIYRVSDALTDTAPQFTRWSEPVLVGWLNEAQLVIAKYLPYTCARVDSIRLAPGTRQSIGTITAAQIVPGDGGTPVAINGNVLMSVSRNMGQDGRTPGRTLRIVDRDVLDSSNPNWHIERATAAPRQYAFDPRVPKAFYVSPPVTSDVPVWVEVMYMADPIPVPVGSGLAGSTVRLSVDDKNSDDVFNYVVARAQMKDAEVEGNAALASTYINLFTASINAQSTTVLGVNPNLSSLPLSPNMAATAR